MLRTLAVRTLVLSVAAAGAAHAQARRPLVPMDLYHIHEAGAVALSPDGRTVVYVVSTPDSATNKYKRDLWMASTDGTGAPRRLTWTGGSSLSAPAFSPDGRTLAFVAARDGGKPQVWILPLADGGEAWPLTDPKTGAGGPVWSPRGDRIAFTSSLTPAQLDSTRADTAKVKVDAGAIRRIDRDRAAADSAIRVKLRDEASDNDPHVITRLEFLGENAVEYESFSQVYMVDARQGARPVRLTSGTWASSGPAWSPDGQSIVFSSGEPNAGETADYQLESDLVVVPASGGAPRRIREPGFGEAGPRFSPDGRWIAYVRSNQAPDVRSATDAELVLEHPDGSGRVSVSGGLDRGVGAFRFTPDGWLYFTVQSEGAAPLYRTRLDRIAPEPVVTGARGVLAFDVAGGRVAWAQMSPARPSDVYAAGLDGRGERRLTALNDTLLAGVYVADYEEVRYPSFDGRRIQGWIMRPIGYQAGTRYPLAVEIHGGPHAMWGPGEASMWLEYQSLASAGYVVFFCNPRGSGGYGNEWLRSIHRDWGSPPARDILIGADTVIARGLADGARQGVVGGSYAGYMVAWLVAKESPERFRAAVAQRGVYDLTTWWGASNTWRLFESEFGGRPWEVADVARAQSPITYVANVRTPLLMLHGEADYRTTIAGAYEFYRALKVLNREVEMVTYPREGHEVTRAGEPAHRVDHMLRIVDWMERHISH